VLRAERAAGTHFGVAVRGGLSRRQAVEAAAAFTCGGWTLGSKYSAFGSADSGRLVLQRDGAYLREEVAWRRWMAGGKGTDGTGAATPAATHDPHASLRSAHRGCLPLLDQCREAESLAPGSERILRFLRAPRTRRWA
jgi:hypothetical protein